MNQENNPDDVIDSSLDRGLPATSSKSSSNKLKNIIKNIKLFGGLTLVIIIVAPIMWFFNKSDDAVTGIQPNTTNRQISNNLGELPQAAPQREPEIVTQPSSNIIQTGQLMPPLPPQTGIVVSDEFLPRQRKLLSSSLAYGNTSTPVANQPIATQAPTVYSDGLEGLLGGPTPADGLAARLEATTVDGASAGLLTDPSYFITQGTFLDCVMETAISSDVPGMTACRLTRDIYSTDAKVLLLERGSRVIGEYQSGLNQGQARIFVLWSRIETPAGVIVNLDSPGTDSLGRSGLSGHVDTHFWARFGGALMLSLVDDIGTYAASAAASSGNNTQIQFGGLSDFTQNAASIALENSINIPPTLIKNQGEPINIYVARDLDFRGVYQLKLAGE